MLFLQQFYESEGVILNDPEILPKDPFIDKRFNALQKRTFHTPDVTIINFSEFTLSKTKY